MIVPEFSRMIDARAVDGRALRLEASTAECAALAQRFAIVAIASLSADLTLNRDGEAIAAKGGVQAQIVQSCAISGEDLAVAVTEDLAIRFVPETTPLANDIELTAEELDDIPFTGTHFDLGEAVAQTLALAIDPYAAGPAADAARQSGAIVGEGMAGPFAALAGLK